MSEPIVGVITDVKDDSYSGKDFKVVTLGTGQVLKVKYGREGALKAKWGILTVGTAIKFTMGDYQGKPFVSDIETVASALPTETPAPEMIPDHNAEIEKALKEVAEQPPKITEAPIAPQELGMWYKEAGELYRAGFLNDDNPVEKKVKQKYFNRLFKVLGIDVQY